MIKDEIIMVLENNDIDDKEKKAFLYNENLNYSQYYELLEKYKYDDLYSSVIYPILCKYVDGNLGYKVDKQNRKICKAKISKRMKRIKKERNYWHD